jgi:hypothetical protein
VEELSEGALLIAGLEELSSLGKVRGGSRDAHAIEGGAVAQIPGVFGVGLLVGVKGSVVIFAGFGGLSGLVEGVGGLAALGVESGSGERKEGRDGEEDGGKNRTCTSECGAGKTRTYRTRTHGFWMSGRGGIQR